MSAAFIPKNTGVTSPDLDGTYSFGCYISSISTKRVVHDTYLTTTDVVNSTLTQERIQILLGLIFAVNFFEHISDDEHSSDTTQKLNYMLEGSTMSNAELGDTFTWNAEEPPTIVRTYSESRRPGKGQSTYQVSHVDGYVVLECPEDDGVVVKVTLKNGKLESIADEPAVSVSYNGAIQRQMWFHQNICYRAANPQLPARIYGGNSIIYYHHDTSGKVFRDPQVGAAIYELVEQDGNQVEEPVQYLIDALSDPWSLPSCTNSVDIQKTTHWWSLLRSAK